MATLNKRLEDLERKTEPEGPIVVAYLHDDDCNDLPPAEQKARLEDAHRRAGPHGTVLVVRYVDNWRSNG